MKVLHISIFHGAVDRHGGARRSDQICEALAELADDNLEVETISLARREFSKIRLMECILFIRFALLRLPILLYQGLSLLGAMWLLRYGPSIRAAIYRSKPDHVLLEFSTGAPALVAMVLSELQVPFSVLPHNVEFMVPGQEDGTFRGGGAAFESEVGTYKRAVLAFCISDFDRRVLQCLSINASLFPYYPVRDDVEGFLEVRRQRVGRNKRHLLVLGTALNPPTRKGMEGLLEEINAAAQWTIPVIVAGFGTEALQQLSSSRIKVLGGVSRDVMSSLLLDAYAVIVSQPATSGFLTRLVECNLSGIPVYVTGAYAQADGLEEKGIFHVESVLSLKDGMVDRNGGFDLFQRPDAKALSVGFARKGVK